MFALLISEDKHSMPTTYVEKIDGSFFKSERNMNLDSWEIIKTEKTCLTLFVNAAEVLILIVLKQTNSLS